MGNDTVNHPEHYTFGSVECIEAIRSALGDDGFASYCQGNAMKYLWRHRRKGGIEDLEKAKWYIDRMIEAEGELVLPLDEAVEWCTRGGVIVAGRGNDKAATADELARANPALGRLAYGLKPEDEK